MRVLDGLAKALGGFVLLAVVVLLPLVGVAQRAFHTIYDASTLTEAVETYWLTPAALARLGRGYVHERQQQTPSNDRTLLFWRALDALNENQWQTLMTYLAPPEAVHTVVSQGAEAWVRWLRAPGAAAQVEVVLTPWKQAVQANAASLTAWLLKQFRECTVPETARWAEATLRNNWALAPLCVPLGTPRQAMEQVVAAAVEAGVASAPDTVNLLDPRKVPLTDLEAAKRALLQAHTVSQLALVVVVLLGLAGVSLIARSWGGWLQAAGVTLMVGGALTVLVGLSAPVVTAWVMGAAAGQVPAWAQTGLEGTVALYAGRILRPLMLWGGGLVGVGVLAALVGGFFQARRRHDRASTLRAL